MEFEVSQLDDHCNLVRLTGRMDSPGVDRIETRFTAAVTAANRDAVVDLSGVDFLASMGIRMFIANARAMSGKGKRLALFGATEMVRDVLESVAIDQIIPVAADQDQALRALAR
ncbi:MAG TPA: STAS domain-containing protein [Ramlibacter sp.]|uniref:STAS domain-containing protein n=1 Tax=Ramlibacter sp. TaxID=1917967 RepID=UPI002C610062|nr:STAS domain-containing protein [Ramlibacter sp.]HVZ45991.1 STAS domain-containing protein [Ramlibacter sp.]